MCWKGYDDGGCGALFKIFDARLTDARASREPYKLLNEQFTSLRAVTSLLLSGSWHRWLRLWLQQLLQQMNVTPNRHPGADAHNYQLPTPGQQCDAEVHKGDNILDTTQQHRCSGTGYPSG
jgi:hypothetical protein